MTLTQRHRPRFADSKLAYAYMESPVGRLLLAGDGRELWLISFPEERGACEPGTAWRESPSLLREAIRQLDAYFRGALRKFDLRLHLEGSAFQRSVWNALPSIPYGATVSYGELARRIGRPSAVRAVGAANGANPLPIVLPCHRVIGANGKLVGYDGGLASKARLLALERGALRE